MYESLRKLYYGDEDAYKAAYQARYISPQAVHLDFPIGDRSSFFVQDQDVINGMYSILRLDKRISELCSVLPGLALRQYSRKCLIDEIVITNNIEGVYSSRKEIGDALAVLEEQSARQERRPRFYGMVSKYNKLIRREAVPLGTCQDVRSIYDELVLDEVVAEDRNNAPDGSIFRRDQATIHSATDRVIHAGLTPESRIIGAMEKALAFLNDESIERLYRICLFHYMLEYIHPFYDGNGRLGRFIVSYCIAGELTPLLAYRLSETIKENVKEYYEAFKVCNDPRDLGDLTPFLIMMLNMIQRSSEELLEALKRRHTRWQRYDRLSESLPGGNKAPMGRLYSLLIQAALFAEQGISTQELAQCMEMSPSTLRKKLGTVREQGLLLWTKDGTKKYYSMDLDELDRRVMAL